MFYNYLKQKSYLFLIKLRQLKYNKTVNDTNLFTNKFINCLFEHNKLQMLLDTTGWFKIDNENETKYSQAELLYIVANCFDNLIKTEKNYLTIELKVLKILIYSKYMVIPFHI